MFLDDIRGLIGVFEIIVCHNMIIELIDNPYLLLWIDA